MTQQRTSPELPGREEGLDLAVPIRLLPVPATGTTAAALVQSLMTDTVKCQN